MILVRTPLRVEFLGGGTDLDYFYRRTPGLVLNATIDKYIYVALNPRLDGKIRASHDTIELVDRIDQLEHQYLRAGLKLFGITGGLEIGSFSDITSRGSGLGSSSSFSVALLHALSALKKRRTTPRVLAELASHLEIDILKAGIGKQDQYAAAFGGVHLLTFNRNGSVGVQKIKLTPRIYKRFHEHFLVFSTGATRSASTILQHQAKLANRNFPFLKQMRDLVPGATQAFQKGDWKKFGEFLEAEWTIKKNLSADVTNMRLEKMYKTAKQAGAWGGRVSGAGGGGFMILMVPAAKHAAVKRALKKYQCISMRLVEDGSQVLIGS